MTALSRLAHRIRHPQHRDFLRGSSIVAIIQIAGLGLVFLLQILIARLIDDPEQYGIYAWGQSLLFMAGTMCAVGVPIAASKFIATMSVNNNEAGIAIVIKQSWKIIFTAALLLTATLLLYSTYTRDGIHVGEMPETVLLIAIYFSPIVSIALLYQQICKARRWRVLAFVPMKILRPILVGGLITAIWFLSDTKLSGTAVIKISIIGIAIIVVAQVILYQLKISQPGPPITHAIDSSTVNTEQLWDLAFPIFLSRIASIVIKYSGIFLLGILVSPVAAGAYFAAERLASLVSIPASIVDAVSSPSFAAAHALKDYKALQTAATQAAHGSFWPTLIIAFILFAFGYWLLGLFGKSYIEATPILIVLIIGQVANSFTGSVTSLLNMGGEHKVVSRVTIATALTHILMISLLLPWLGAMGAAIASMFTTVIYSFWLLYEVKHRMNIQPTILAS